MKYFVKGSHIGKVQIVNTIFLKQSWHFPFAQSNSLAEDSMRPNRDLVNIFWICFVNLPNLVNLAITHTQKQKSQIAKLPDLLNISEAFCRWYFHHLKVFTPQEWDEQGWDWVRREDWASSTHVGHRMTKTFPQFRSTWSDRWKMDMTL